MMPRRTFGALADRIAGRRAAPLAAGLAAVLVAVAAVARDTGHGKPLHTTPVAARGETCVAPTEDMRRNHMKHLHEQRDRTMREGFRDPRFSLKGCVDCHASEKTHSVLGEEGFCAGCHSYASVKIDCFECHASQRRAAARAAGK